MNTENKTKLVEMLSYKRPAFSEKEKEFVNKYIMPCHSSAYMDGYGNVIVDTCINPNTMFSCHTDTVDLVDGHREVIHDYDLDILFAKDDILGADDGTGVFIMLEMIKHNIPGRYIFHREEENYCAGSSWLMGNTPNVLKGLDKAIAFDRMGTGDVITHMLSRKCVTNKFANALCETLNCDNYSFEPVKGVFTDTVMYSEVIPNCTNISVGYFNQHTKDEFQDLLFLNSLIDKIKKIDWQLL